LEAGGDRDLAVKAAHYLAKSRNKHYWSNTYATAQVIRAIVDLSTTGDEQNPNYTYSVELNGKRISGGTVTSATQNIKKIIIPLKDVGESASSIKVKKSGSGQMYSTLVVNEFRTDRNYQPVGKALKITRQIVNDKDEYRSLGVGEIARIKLTIEGITDNSDYVVVEDTLPSGMVPVIESFKNEQSNNNDYYSWGREYKEDGVIFSNSYWQRNRVLEYKARVINSGDFWLPPATVELMYSPEVNGQSNVEHIYIQSQAEDLPRSPKEAFNKATNKLGVLLRDFEKVGWQVVIIAFAVTLIIEKKTGIFKKILEKIKNKSKLQKKDIDNEAPIVNRIDTDKDEENTLH